jgi:sirohydrochlorin cobaltochelatase
MKKESKEAILLAAFGTTVPGSDRIFSDIEQKVRRKYPGIPIGWAFTSKKIRTWALAKGKDLPPPETALAELVAKGATHVAVLSLHIVQGEEFQKLCGQVEGFQAEGKGLKKFEIAGPLLSSHEDVEAVCEILVRKFYRQDPHEGVIFVGHGNRRHVSDAIYVNMNSLLIARRFGFFVGTVDGCSTPNDLLQELNAAGIKKVTLVPLMTIAGQHARQDMAGDEPESWKSVLAANGIDSESVFTGLAEDPNVVSIWLNHLDKAFASLSAGFCPL